MQKREFLRKIIEKKIIDKEIYDLSMEIEGFPIARQVLQRIDNSVHLSAFLNSSNEQTAIVSKQDLYLENIALIKDSQLRGASKKFLDELLDLKILDFRRKNLKKSKSKKSTEIPKPKNETDKIDAQFYFEKGCRLMESKEYENAIEEFNKVINLSPSFEVSQKKYECMEKLGLNVKNNKVNKNKGRESFLQGQQRKLAQQKGENFTRKKINNLRKKQENSFKKVISKSNKRKNLYDLVRFVFNSFRNKESRGRAYAITFSSLFLLTVLTLIISTGDFFDYFSPPKPRLPTRLPSSGCKTKFVPVKKCFYGERMDGNFGWEKYLKYCKTVKTKITYDCW